MRARRASAAGQRDACRRRDIRLTPANSPYAAAADGRRGGAQQGQGPGFASDASLRGFSSDHSTDIALWIDGVPINEPVNGHAEGYNDWSLLFPGGIQDIDVIHGPTSALFGNFALAGVVNVRTLERMRGTRGHRDRRLVRPRGRDGRSRDSITARDGGGVLGARYQREDGLRPNARLRHRPGTRAHRARPSPGVTLDGGAELYGGNWNSPGFLSEDEFAAHDYDIVSNPTDGGYKRRAQERVSLRVLAGQLLWRTTAYATQGRWQLFLTIPPAGGRFEGIGQPDRGRGFTRRLRRHERAHLGAAARRDHVGAEARWDRSHYENYFTTDARSAIRPRRS